MLVTMAKVEIIGPKKFFYPVVGLLHQLGTVHLEDMSKKSQDFVIRQMSVDEYTEQAKTDLGNVDVQLEGIMEALKSEKDNSGLLTESDFYKKVWHKETPQLIEEAESLIDKVEEKARTLANRKTDLELELTSINRYIDIVEKIKPLADQIITLEDFETVAFLLERKFKDTIDVIKMEMAALTDNKYELVSADVDEDTTAALVIFHKKYSGPVHAFLSDNVNEVRLPSELQNKSFDEVAEEMQSRRTQIPSQIEDIKKQLSLISNKWYYKIKAIHAAINDRLDEMLCVPQFGETDYTFVVQGWLPRKNLSETRKQIKKRFGEKVLVDQLELSDHDLEEAPVVIQNHRWAKPFEQIMKIVQPPKYGTMDPTPIIAIFFPLFFGFIVGDMGYALIIFAAATLFKKKFQKSGMEAGEAVCTIFQIASVVAFIFGIAFGEFFGDLLLPEGPIAALRLIKPTPLPFNIPGTFPFPRSPESLMFYLGISVAFGYIHLFIGLIIGIVNAVREKARKHIFEKAGLLIVLIGALIAVVLTMKTDIGYLPGLLIIILGIGIAIYGSGALNGIEHTIGTMSNLFSYMRLIAVGLAGVILAEVANKLTVEFAKNGGIFILVGILMGSFLHILNVTVAAISPAIHSIRLNIIEFFNRFYESGGRTYNPFKVRR